MLTESEVQKDFSRLMKGGATPESIEKAELLLDELRAESPLRHRLWVELEEIRKLQSAKG